MENTNHRENLEKLLNSNKQKLQKLKDMLDSLDKIESSINKKIEMHQKYVEILQNNFKQSIDTYHNICKNLVPQVS